MKKILCTGLAALLCLFTLSSCSARAPVSVNGTPIDKGIYCYFADAAKRENPDAEAAALETATYQKISEYVAVNSAFAERELALTTAEKADVSQRVNAYWRLFGTYYTGLDVTKQDLLKVYTTESYKNAVLVDYYAPDGDEPVAEETLQTYFNENYVAFKSITGFLTTADNNGDSVPLSEEERTALVTSFEGMASAVQAGSSIEEQAQGRNNILAETETVVLSKSSEQYPADFFTQVFAMENNAAKAFVSGDYIFLVQRENLADPDRNLFAVYRTDCLKTLKGEAFEAVLADWVQAYVVQAR